MNKSVANYISELLFIHDCVIVPEFGGFVGNQRSAQLNTSTGSLTPPSKQVLFNTNLRTNDGLLITHIANQEDIPQKIAKKNVQIFADECNTKLSTSKVLRIPKIGLFTVGKEGNILFLQDSVINYSLDSFGMKTTYNKSILRKKEKPAEKITQKIKNTTSHYRVVMRAAAIIIPLLVLAYLSVSQQDKINNVYTQMATFNPFAPTKVSKVFDPTNETKIESKIDASKNEVVENLAIDIAEEEEISLIDLSGKTYYIIAGAFAEQKNANKMLKKLLNKKYNAEILTGSRLLRVCYDSFYNREDAVLVLNKIKRKNPEAWLLTK